MGLYVTMHGATHEAYQSIGSHVNIAALGNNQSSQQGEARCPNACVSERLSHSSFGPLAFRSAQTGPVLRICSSARSTSQAGGLHARAAPASAVASRKCSDSSSRALSSSLRVSGGGAQTSKAGVRTAAPSQNAAARTPS